MKIVFIYLILYKLSERNQSGSDYDNIYAYINYKKYILNIKYI